MVENSRHDKEHLMPGGSILVLALLLFSWPLSAPAADKIVDHSFFPSHVSIDALDGAGSRAVQKVQYRP